MQNPPAFQRITTEQLLKTLLDYLATWEKLIGNDRRNPLILNDYYVKILDLWPTQPYEETGGRPWDKVQLHRAALLG